LIHSKHSVKMALPYLKRAKVLWPNSAVNLRSQFHYFIRTGDLTKAAKLLEILKEGTQIQPSRLAHYHFLLVEMSVRQKDCAGVTRNIEAAIAVAPNFSHYISHREEIHALRNKCESYLSRLDSFSSSDG